MNILTCIVLGALLFGVTIAAVYGLSFLIFFHPLIATIILFTIGSLMFTGMIAAAFDV